MTTRVERGCLGIHAGSSKVGFLPLLYRCCQGVIISCRKAPAERLTIERLFDMLCTEHAGGQSEQEARAFDDNYFPGSNTSTLYSRCADVEFHCPVARWQ